MLDMWMKSNRKMIDEIIEESNLKEVVKKKLDDYMITDEFAEFLDNVLKNEIKRFIEEYAEFYMIGDDGWDEVADKVKQIIREHRCKHKWETTGRSRFTTTNSYIEYKCTKCGQLKEEPILI